MRRIEAALGACTAWMLLAFVGCDLPAEVRAERQSRALRAERAAAAEACAGEPASLARAEIVDLVGRHGLSDPVSRTEFAELVVRESTAAGLDPLIVAAVIARESSFRPGAISSAGAVGLMQLRPWVARDVALRSGEHWRGSQSLFEPEVNVRLGVRYLDEMVERFEGDTRTALAAYNRGPTRVRDQLRAGTFRSGRYAEDVLSLYERLARAGRADGSCGPDGGNRRL